MKDHYFFWGTDWPAVEQVNQICQTAFCQTSQGTITPPFLPELCGDGDTSNFDEEFTNGSLEQTKVKLSKSMKNRCEDGFHGFSFTAE